MNEGNALVFHFGVIAMFDITEKLHARVPRGPCAYGTVIDHHGPFRRNASDLRSKQKQTWFRFGCAVVMGGKNAPFQAVKQA